MWFGTMDGLNKYDGYSFTKYRFDPFDSNSLAQNFIYTIFEDKSGSIWIGTHEGLCRFERSTEKFIRYKPLPHAGFSNPNISAINEDPDGMIWVGSTSGELSRFDRQTGKFLEKIDLGYRQLPDDQTGVHRINCIYKDRSGTLWVGTLSGLHQLHLTPVKGQPSKVGMTNYEYDPGNPQSLSSNNVASVFEDQAGMLWIATDNGLNGFDRKKGIFIRYTHDPKNIHSISSNNLTLFSFGTAVQEDGSGNLWICTDSGLNKLNADRTVFTAYYHNPREAHSLSSNNIYALEIDQAGILWAGSWSGKLDKADLNHKAFGIIRHNPDNINSLSNNEVTSILEDSSGAIWISTFGGGLNRWDRKTNQFTRFRHDPSNPKTLRYDTIQVIFEDRHGNLWIGNGNILSRFNKHTGDFTHYFSNAVNKSIEPEMIFSIAEDRQGLLWLGMGNGIEKFNAKTGESVHYYYDPPDSNGISDNTVTTIFADSRNNIWVGHGSRATDRLNRRTGHFTHYKHDPHDSASISSNIVNCFYEDSKGNLWFGTISGGLCLFDFQQEKFKTFTDKHGLPDNSVFSIVEDNNGHLWLGTRMGLSRFDPGTKTFTNYDYKDGLQGNIFASGYRERAARFKGGDGTLYFGGNNGFNFFDPSQLKANNIISPIVITQFKLFDKLVRGANESKEIVLDHDQNNFSFEFSSLSYSNPAKNQYAYKLEGVDKDWVYSGSRRYVAYTNIDPGKYTFKVKGTNHDGSWNEKGTSISIIIHPPWWSTWWAYSLSAGVFFVALWGFIKWRERTLKKEKLLLAQKVALRTHELQDEKEKVESTLAELRETQTQLVESEKMASVSALQQAMLNERLRISRELHDNIGGTLSGIVLYSHMAENQVHSSQPGEVENSLNIIQQSANEMVNRLNDLVWTVNPGHSSLKNLVQKLEEYAMEMALAKNMKVQVHAPESLAEIQLPVESRHNIYLLTKEAINNAVKYSHASRLALTVHQSDHEIEFTITDNGDGFDMTTVKKGNGLINMRKRAEEAGAILSVRSAPGEGTIILLQCKIT
jgi:ligand-binding sensor domain-containing protein/signal transduction histidine kinase